VGRREWDNIFGKGYNNKVFLYFTVPPIWKAEEHSFSPEILLWSKYHKNDWGATQPKLGNWARKLQKAGYQFWLYGRGKSGPYDLTKLPLSESPGEISAWSDKDIISERVFKRLSGDELVDMLQATVIKHCEIVDALR
jgi:hypothetical protein